MIGFGAALCACAYICAHVHMEVLGILQASISGTLPPTSVVTGYTIEMELFVSVSICLLKPLTNLMLSVCSIMAAMLLFLPLIFIYKGL